MGSFKDTLDTTRVRANDPFTSSVIVSRMTFPSRKVPWRPSAVILVPPEPYHFSFLAASLIHFPINATFLFTQADTLLNITLEEILRLSPRGDCLPAPVLLVGPIGFSVESRLLRYGFRTLRIQGRDVFETAANAAFFRLLTVSPKAKKGRDHILVVSADTGMEGLSATYYSAHQGTPIVFVTRTSIPSPTKAVAAKFADRTFTLFGSEKTISRRVEEELRGIVSHVDRIEGENPYEISVHFARRSEPRLGWNRNVKGRGDAFSFGTLSAWQKAVSGVLFAHLGKHTPLLLVRSDRVPSVVREYLLFLNPAEPKPPMPPFMHGFILGDEGDIADSVQTELEEHLILRAEEH